ncbi:SMP-30/gluconolactonase/LRE family protein [Pseudohongiella sp.]|uniref:SMP-30/Gluconolactonase/LRE-like region domain-containing protein n=1 Tax=marine sediment metagenome TaxID=412755 RepID=A0A0F9Y3G0_9ZZZZ|nr:SMP-30/gluconolactonase/LRE family protein [Pseudohongiella sp.]HDZ08796.1 SMP-30/gluconolactonase/LRE family protein [Pseudohongiella sp.]HEA62412.1 SMP-30/gluconolactonase/LRE family protein [Pseudohongiella sp.]
MKTMFLRSIAGVAAVVAGSVLAQGSDLVAPGAEVELLTDGFIFTEGPVADAAGNVYFSDIPANTNYVWTNDGELQTFRTDSNGTNGLFFDRNWQLFAAEGGAGRITALDSDGQATVIVGEHNGQRFNSPNDLWIDASGGIYFTDPRYGDESNNPQPGYYVYYLAPGTDEAEAIITDLVKPNGIIGTHDGQTLYVADHLGNETYAYDITAPGELSNKRLLAAQGSDGLTLDEHGNLYLTGGNNITVYNPAGELIDTLTFPLAPANMTFGGPERDVLYVTARSSLFALPMNVKGMY